MLISIPASMLHANCKTLGHGEEIWVIHCRDIVKIKKVLSTVHRQAFFFSCLHWFFIAGGPGWPTGPIRRLLLFWGANIILGKLKIKLISDTKLHSSVLGLPVQARRPLTCASPTPKQLWIFYLAAVFSGFADVVLGAARPSALPREKARLRKGAGLEKGLCYSHDNSGLYSGYACGREQRLPAEPEIDSCTHLGQRQRWWPQLKVCRVPMTTQH